MTGRDFGQVSASEQDSFMDFGGGPAGVTGAAFTAAHHFFAAFGGAAIQDFGV